MSTTTSNPNLTVNIINNCADGDITFNGFPTSYNPNPVEHGGPPLILPTIPNDGKSYTAFQVSDCYSGETQGEAYFNMPSGVLLNITWHVYNHSESNPDEANYSIACTGYAIEYQQKDGSYSTDVYWAVTDVNTFATTISITE